MQATQNVAWNEVVPCPGFLRPFHNFLQPCVWVSFLRRGKDCKSSASTVHNSFFLHSFLAGLYMYLYYENT